MNDRPPMSDAQLVSELRLLGRRVRAHLAGCRLAREQGTAQANAGDQPQHATDTADQKGA